MWESNLYPSVFQYNDVALIMRGHVLSERGVAMFDANIFHA